MLANHGKSSLSHKRSRKDTTLQLQSSARTALLALVAITVASFVMALFSNYKTTALGRYSVEKKTCNSDATLRCCRLIKHTLSLSFKAVMITFICSAFSSAKTRALSRPAAFMTTVSGVNTT